jgi:hypothetical protein
MRVDHIWPNPAQQVAYGPTLPKERLGRELELVHAHAGRPQGLGKRVPRGLAGDE